MTNNKPLVSIGMPVYNGERFIGQALDSLLAQDYKNFELIISDNASTDHTPEICRGYVARDSRIRYYRNERNFGSIKNFDRTLELSTGKYFMWAADHDLWNPTFISRCVPILEEDTEVVLAYSRTMLIDPDGNPIGLIPDELDTRGMSAVRRHKRILWHPYCIMVYGVIRRETLGQTGMLRNVWGPDHIVLAELALRGSVAQIPEPLFYLRKNRSDEGSDERTRRVLFDLDPVNALEKSKKSSEDLHRESCDSHLQILAHAPIGFLERLRATIATIVCFRFRFGVRLRSLLLVEWLVAHSVPRKLRHALQRWILSWLKI